MGSVKVNDHYETVPLLIGGKSIKSTPGQTIPVRNASKGEIVGYAEAADVQNATDAVESAATAFPGWKTATVSVRRDLILKTAELFKQNQSLLMGSLQEETGCTPQWAAANIAGTIHSLQELAAGISMISGDIPQTDNPANLSLVFKVPVGPVLVIAPWNGGIVLPAKAITQPLAAGCTVVFKASELCPRTHHLVAKMFMDAGLPEGALNVIQSRREDAGPITETIISHPAIRKIDFIGSAAVGKVIGQLAAKNLKPVLMELGGKCPAIVLDDADLSDAAMKCAVGSFLHHGQICFSTERIIVLESVAEEFKKELQVKSQQWQPVDGVSERIIDNALSMLQDAESKGCEFLVGGADHVRPSALKPSIVTKATRDMKIYDDESFGPSATLYVVKTEQEAVQVANDTSYGLSAAVHSRDWGRALRVARQIECGTIWVNGLTVREIATCPIGGHKGSGWGRSNHKWGLSEYFLTQVVNIPNTAPNL